MTTALKYWIESATGKTWVKVPHLAPRAQCVLKAKAEAGHVPDDAQIPLSQKGVANGYDWDNAMSTVDAGMKAVASGKTLHIGFGSYTNEPADNVQSPTNSNVTVVFETIGSTGGTGTATVELN